MENLKDYISKHRNLLDTVELPEGHEERFAKKINTNNRYSIRKIARNSLKVAAISVMAIMSTLYVIKSYEAEQPNLKTLSQLDSTYSDVEFYYTSTSSNLMNTIEDILNGESIFKKEMIINELKSLDSLHINLQTELNANPYDQKVINTMIEFYRFRIGILTQIVEQLKSMTTSKNYNHETKSL